MQPGAEQRRRTLRAGQARLAALALVGQPRPGGADGNPGSGEPAPDCEPAGQAVPAEDRQKGERR